MITVPARARRAAFAVASGALVLGAALLPGDPGPAGHLAALTGANQTPWAAAPLAIAAALAVWRLPAVWPLATVVIAAPLIDPTAADASLAIASFAAAGRLKNPGGRAAYLMFGTVWTVFPLAVGLSLQGTAPVSALQVALGSALLFVWSPFSLGLWLAARREVLAGARERVERLEREQRAAADRARAQERARVAHDMHDVVAHRVSLMVLYAGALEVNATDRETAETADLIRATGAEALEQLRVVLGVLKASEPTLSASGDLERLIADSVRAGVPVTLRCNGSLDDVPVPLARTVYRAAREALTNVHKHAGAAATAVEVDCAPDRVALRVGNEAPPRPVRTLPGTGTGLAAIGEAVTLLGGTLTSGPLPDGGYELNVALPRSPDLGRPA